MLTYISLLGQRKFECERDRGHDGAWLPRHEYRDGN